MKKKSLILFSSFLLTGAAIGVTAFSGGSSLKTSGAGLDCVWNHYNAVEGSYLDNGSKEYWVCCTHKDHVFEKPTAGTISEAGAPSEVFVKSLSTTDDRYDIKETDHVVAIKAAQSTDAAGKFQFGSREKFIGLKSITFDAKWENLTTAGWYGFGHSSDISKADIYTGMMTMSVANDGEWHTIEKTFESTDEYLYFIAEAGNKFNEDATILLKNIKVTDASGVHEELALGTGNLFRSYYNSDYPELKAPSLSYETRGRDGTNTNMALKLDVNSLNANTGKLNLVSTLDYKGIKKVTLRYKATGGPAVEGKTPWGGFAIASDPSKCDVYSYFNCANAAFTPTYDGEWHDLELTGIDGDGYIFFAAAVGEYQEGTTFYFDSLTISYYWNNCSTTETFNQDCTLFKHSADVRGNAWTTVAVD